MRVKENLKSNANKLFSGGESRKQNLYDEIDIKEHALKIHHKYFKKFLSDDVTLGVFKDEKVIKFFQQMVKAAVEVKDYLADEKTAEEESAKVLLEGYVHIYTTRNQGV